MSDREQEDRNDDATEHAVSSDPWGHEHGEDPTHLLDPSGHARHQQDMPEGDFTIEVRKPRRNRWRLFGRR